MAMKYPLNEKAARFAEQNTQAFIDLTAELAVIPAPSNHEELRAEWCKKHFESFGAEGVYIDEALNVVWPVGCEGRDDIVVIMAHTDVVFPDTTPLPLKIENGRMCAPGVGDDTANLTGMLTVARYVKENGLKPKTGVLFVANSGEEGLGNLKGSRQIMKDYAGRVKELISFDGYYSGVWANAVGSQRYKVTVRTEGGHSYAAFGNRNAIYYLAKLIDIL
jgi:acetylornithine deacetylase/succinyl-diaminopimelate desuccinylase-like protein